MKYNSRTVTVVSRQTFIFEADFFFRLNKTSGLLAPRCAPAAKVSIGAACGRPNVVEFSLVEETARRCRFSNVGRAFVTIDKRIWYSQLVVSIYL